MGRLRYQFTVGRMMGVIAIMAVGLFVLSSRAITERVVGVIFLGSIILFPVFITAKGTAAQNFALGVVYIVLSGLLLLYCFAWATLSGGGVEEGSTEWWAAVLGSMFRRDGNGTVTCSLLGTLSIGVALILRCVWLWLNPKASRQFGSFPTAKGRSVEFTSGEGGGPT